MRNGFIASLLLLHYNGNDNFNIFGKETQNAENSDSHNNIRNGSLRLL